MITSNISNAVDALNQGDLVAIPTETVYGLAGSAFNEQAIHKTFQLKIKPKKKTNSIIPICFKIYWAT